MQNHWFKWFEFPCGMHYKEYSVSWQVSWNIYVILQPLNELCLTHWSRETHICVCEHANIGSDNGLSPHRRQAIIWTNAGILSIGPLGTNFNEISIGIQTSSFKKMHFKMSSAKWRPFCLGLNVLREVERSPTHWSLRFRWVRFLTAKNASWYKASTVRACVA